MPPPIDEFTARGTVNGSDALVASVAANITQYTGPWQNLAQSFLSAQAEVLIAGGCTVMNLVSKATAGVGPKSAGMYDSATHTMNLTADNIAIDILRTAAHEMTHGIEFERQCHTEGRVNVMFSQDPTNNPLPQDEVTAIYKAIQSSLPSGASQIQEQFRAQVSSQGGPGAVVPLEIGAYTNESIFHEIRSVGNAAAFIARFHDVGKVQIEAASPRAVESAEKARDTAKEIIAVSVCDINNHIIERLEARANLDDLLLATELKTVNNALLPAYQRAEEKYNAIFIGGVTPPLNSSTIRHRQVHIIEPASDQTALPGTTHDTPGISSSPLNSDSASLKPDAIAFTQSMICKFSKDIGAPTSTAEMPHVISRTVEKVGEKGVGAR